MQYLLIGIIVACGAMIQGAIGFAFGIFSIPLLVMTGLPLEQAITLVLGLIVIQTLASVWPNREHIHWPDVAGITIPRFFTVGIGIYLLHLARAHWPPSRIKQMLGICLLVIIAIQLWLRPTPRERLGKSWTWLAGCVSGVMAGLIGMGGPAVVLWVVAHDWDSKRSRTLMWCTFSLLVPWQLLLNYHRFGSPVMKSALLGVCYTPVVVLATMVGTRLGNRIPQEVLRRIAYCVLVGMGLMSLLSPFFGK